MSRVGSTSLKFDPTTISATFRINLKKYKYHGQLPAFPSHKMDYSLLGNKVFTSGTSVSWKSRRQQDSHSWLSAIQKRSNMVLTSSIGGAPLPNQVEWRSFKALMNLQNRLHDFCRPATLCLCCNIDSSRLRGDCFTFGTHPPNPKGRSYFDTNSWKLCRQSECHTQPKAMCSVWSASLLLLVKWPEAGATLMFGGLNTYFSTIFQHQNNTSAGQPIDALRCCSYTRRMTKAQW